MHYDPIIYTRVKNVQRVPFTKISGGGGREVGDLQVIAGRGGFRIFQTAGGSPFWAFSEKHAVFMTPYEF